MFKFTVQYNNVVKFKINKFKLGFIAKNTKDLFIYSLDHFKQLLLIDFAEVYDFIFLSGDDILFSTLNPEKTFIVDGGGRVNEQGYVMHLGGMRDANQFYCLSDYKGQRRYIALNLSNYKVENFWELPFFEPKGKRQVINHRLLTSFIKQSIVSCNALPEGKELWRINLNELSGGLNAKLTGEIISHGKKLFLSVSDSDNNQSRCYVIDSSSGKVIHKCNQFSGYLKVLEAGKLYAVNYTSGTRKKEKGGINDYVKNVLFVLDAETFEESCIDLSETLDPLDVLDASGNITQYFCIKPDHIIVKNNRLYCHADAYAKVAVIDLATKKLLWEKTIEVENYPYPFIKELQVSDGRFFVLDAGGTLHVFEEDVWVLEA